MMRRNAYLRTVLAALLLACFATGEAYAQDDGGGRSILADGAGNRALSLGGAYAGVADDASAVIWNPGGLGLVQRREFQATHTDLMGMGFNEQYASFVLPDWRWGVASLTFRRFGVGGIEGRDDRNLVTDTDLTDTETELILGYGREFGAVWSLGGALKMRKQSLAGFSDSGLGVDLGLMVRPLAAFGATGRHARDLSLGLAVRNAVEPDLRLNEEPVRDPTGVRVGGAYRWHFGREGEVLLAMDVEKTRDMNAHFHGGLEVTVVRPLALRVGTNDGRFVAGAGLYWHQTGIDYQFEDHPTGYFHRFGIALKFGKTRDESRRLSLAREEEELQQRLATAFAGQQHQRKVELLAKAQIALQDEDVAEAFNHLAMIQVIDPDAAELPVLEAEILLLQATEQAAAGDHAAAMVSLSRADGLNPDDPRAAAMLERFRAASDLETRRTAEIRELLDGALEAFAAGDVETARDGFQQVLGLAPDDKEAQAMLAATELAIASRVEGHLAQVRILTNAKQFDRAHGELAAARGLDPEASGLAAAAGYLSDRKARELTTAPSATAPAVASAAGAPGLTAQQQREMDDLYRRGLDAMAADQHAQATHFWELVWSMDPDYENVTENLAQNYLARGMESFVAGDLPEAVTKWEAAVRVDPTDPKALGYLQRAREQTERMRMMDD